MIMEYEKKSPLGISQSSINNMKPATESAKPQVDLSSISLKDK